MNLRPALSALALVAAASLSGCGALTGDASASGDDRVAAAFYPLAYVAEQVAGEHFEVTNLTQPGQESHDLELGPTETAEIAEAALVIIEHGYQPAVDATVEQNAGGEVLDAAEVVELRPFANHAEQGHADEGHAEEGHAEEDHAEEDHTEEAHADEHADEEDHAHGDEDPHFWQDPLLMADLADAVAERLAGLDTEHADDFRANAAALRTELEQLDREYAEGLADCARDLVVVNHDAFGYLARYGLHLEPISGFSPGAEPSAADRARLEQLIRDEGITTVFAEKLVSKKTSQAIANDLGIETGVLDPIEGLTDDGRDEDYLSLMRENLAALQEANGC